MLGDASFFATRAETEASRSACVCPTCGEIGVQALLCHFKARFTRQRDDHRLHQRPKLEFGIGAVGGVRQPEPAR